MSVYRRFRDDDDDDGEASEADGDAASSSSAPALPRVRCGARWSDRRPMRSDD